MKVSAADFRQRLLPILLAQATGLLCGVAGVRLSSYWVNPADYGVYGVFTSLVPVGAGVIGIGLVKFLNRHWAGAADRPGLWRETLAATLRRAPWLLLAAAVLALAAAPGDRLRFTLLLFVSAYLLTLVQLAQSALQAMRAHWPDLGISAGISVARSFGPPLLYLLTGAGALALFSGFALHALFGALLAAWAMRRWWQPGPARTGLLTRVYDGPQFTLLAVAGWMAAGANRWLVAYFFGAETAGYFTLATNIGTILPAMLGLVLLQYCQPAWFATNAPAAAPDRAALLRAVDRVALGYTVAALALAVLLHLAMPALVGSLVGPRYAPAIGFVAMGGFFAASLTIGNFYHVLLLAAKQEAACLTVDLAGAAALLLGSGLGAALGPVWFKGWLLLSPVMPWLVNRTLARRALRAAA